MVDAQHLDYLIAQSGKRKNYLANKLGCSVQAFRMKCTNKSDFKLSEVAILCDELGITKATDKEKIFLSIK